MKKLLVSALALTGLAGAAHAQVDPSVFNLEVVPQLRTYTDNGDGTLTATDVPSGLSVDTRTSAGGGARKVRVELRYRITVTGSTTGSTVIGGTTYSSGGLASTSINVRLTPGVTTASPNPGMLQTAPIGVNAGNTGSGFTNPDAGIDPGSGFGVYAPWRTGVIPADQSFAGNNGILTPNTVITNVLPLATGAPDQRSGTTTASAARFWTLYAFDIMLPANYNTGNATDTQVLTIAAERPVSNGTPAPFLFFPRVGTANQSAAIQAGGSWTGGSVTLTIRGVAVPAPASAALLGVGGLVAARRRRN